MKKNNKVVVATLVTLISLSPILGQEVQVEAASTSVTIVSNAEKTVKTLEFYGKKLNANVAKVSKSLTPIDSKLLNTTSSTYTNAAKKVNALKGSSTKTKLLKRIASQKKVIDKANKYKNAQSAASSITQSQKVFKENFNEDDLSGSFEYLTNLKKTINSGLKYFRELDSKVGTSFTTKYYNPANALVVKYENESNISISLDTLKQNLEDGVPYSELRPQYTKINTNINGLSDSKFKSALLQKLKSIIGELNFSNYQSSVESPDTNLNIYIHGLQIETVGANKKYIIRYTVENNGYNSLVSGKFKVYFKDGTAKIFGETSSILMGETKKNDVTFESTGSDAYLIEYGKDLSETGSLSIGTVYWKVTPISFDDVENTTTTEVPITQDVTN